MGEGKRDREIIQDHVKHLREAGVDHKRAEQMARESMVRVDRKLRDEGKR